MKLEIKNFNKNIADGLRRSGYSFQRREGEEYSFVRPFSRSGYPRFHIYASLREKSLFINIHLDQKKETYGTSTRHHGEYGEDGILLDEVERLKKTLA